MSCCAYLQAQTQFHEKAGTSSKVLCTKPLFCSESDDALKALC